MSVVSNVTLGHKDTRTVHGISKAVVAAAVNGLSFPKHISLDSPTCMCSSQVLEDRPA